MTPTGHIPTGPDDDGDEWMVLFRSLPDAEVDALLAGQPSGSAVGGLSELIGTLRADAERHGRPAMSAPLREQITRVAPGPAPVRRRRILVGAFGGLLLGGAAMGVAGAHEVLPAPLQDATASVAGALGIDLPRAAERGDDDGPGGPVDSGGDDDQGEGGGAGPDDTTGQDDTTATTDSSQGPPATTPGGATPADPGIPGDREPATPATPPTGQGNGNGNGNNASETGQANGTDTTKGYPALVEHPADDIGPES